LFKNNFYFYPLLSNFLIPFPFIKAKVRPDYYPIDILMFFILEENLVGNLIFLIESMFTLDLIFFSTIPKATS